MDRITRLRIQNVRAFEDVTIDLSAGVTVLIGENGAGKSTVIECLELLRRVPEQRFMEQFYNIHRGMPGMLRSGASELALTVEFRDDTADPAALRYGVVLRRQGGGAVFGHEALELSDFSVPPLVVRSPTETRTMVERDGVAAVDIGPPLPSDVSFLAHEGSNAKDAPSGSPAARVRALLEKVEVHVGLDTLAGWAASSTQRGAPLREPSLLRPTRRLSALGLNLTSAWHELKNRPSAEWGATLDLVRLGLGDHVDTVVVALDPGGGNGALYLKLTSSDDPIPAANLSDGQLTWLAYVAMARLGGDRSLLAIDEPELHLHPALLGRVMGLLTDLPGSPQVVIGTHSDRVLAMLDDPADAVRVCSLEGGKAVVSRLDPAELPRWLDEFGDLGQLRASGYLDRVVAEPAPTDE